MKYLMYMLLLSLTWTEAIRAKDWSLVFHCDYGKPDWCIHGKYSKDLDVSFLNTNGNIFYGKTAQRYKYESELHGSFIATKIKGNKLPSEISNIFAAVIGEKVIRLTVLSAKKKANPKLDLSELSKAVLNSIANTKIGTKYELEDFFKVPPEVLVLKKFDVIRLYNSKKNLGPIYIKKNMKIHEVSGQCSSPLTTFKIKATTYIKSRTNCCECGYRDTKIFKLDDDRVIMEFANADWST